MLATDKDQKNKNDAAEFMIHQILMKTFGQSDINLLKGGTLDALNFDRSNQARMREVHSGYYE